MRGACCLDERAAINARFVMRRLKSPSNVTVANSLGTPECKKKKKQKTNDENIFLKYH